jgi:hypothetical protein
VFIAQTKLKRRGVRELTIGSRKTVGFSSFKGSLNSTAQAREIGLASEGWEKHEGIFRQDFLKPFRLKDDVERTIGFWGGQEPSFNAHVRGKRNNVISMAKAWGERFDQDGMALLFPNPNGTGGKLIWDFGRELSDNEMDLFFRNLDDLNKELGEQFNDYFGVTTKGGRSIEYWYSGETQRNNAFNVIREAIRKTGLPATYDKKSGFDFVLLRKGKDY